MINHYDYHSAIHSFELDNMLRIMGIPTSLHHHICHGFLSQRHMRTMVLEYEHQHLPHKWPSCVGKYTSTMEHMGNDIKWYSMVISENRTKNTIYSIANTSLLCHSVYLMYLNKTIMYQKKLIYQKTCYPY